MPNICKINISYTLILQCGYLTTSIEYLKNSINLIISLFFVVENYIPNTKFLLWQVPVIEYFNYHHYDFKVHKLGRVGAFVDVIAVVPG